MERPAYFCGPPAALQTFNIFVHEDQRVEMVLLPIGDGLTLARKII